MIEVWKDISGWEGFYQVSNLGQVKSLARVVRSSRGHRTLKERILKPAPDTYGYLKVVLYKDNVKTSKRVHRLVCETFHGPGPDGLIVLHGPKGELDNSASNLHWGTHSENTLDQWRDGTMRVKPCIVDGQSFRSCIAAAKHFGFPPRSISTPLSAGRTTYKNHTISYAKETT